MAHLFDESALDQQVPLRNEGKSNGRGASRSDDDESFDGEADYDAIEIGDLVTFRAEPSGRGNDGAESLYAVVMPPEDIFIPAERCSEASGSDEWLPVWLVIPSYCGDPQNLFHYVHRDDLVIRDRPVDINTIVADRENLSLGMVCRQRISYSAISLVKLLSYHRGQRHSSAQQRLSSGLAHPHRRSAPIHRQPWYQAAQSHIKIVQDVSELKAKTYSGEFFVRSNPLFVGQHVRSLKRCVDIVDEEFQRRPTPNDIVSVPAVHSDDINTHNLISSEGSSSNSHRGLTHFSGHVRAVSYSALVELIVPPHRGRKSSDDRRTLQKDGSPSQRFLILISPDIIESTIQDSLPKRDVLFRNVRNLFRSDDASSRGGHYVETSDDASVAPPQMDVVAPLMYVEYISLGALKHKVLWIRGSYEEYYNELLSCQDGSATAESRRQTQRKKRGNGSTNSQRTSGTTDSTSDVLCGNGIVVFCFPEVVTAIDFITGLPRDFQAYELAPVETSGSDSAFAGQHGFALADNDPLFDGARNSISSDTAHSGTLSEDPQQSCSVCVMPCTNALLRWYLDHGILADSPESHADWPTRLQKLHSIIDQLVWITSSSSYLSVCWKDTGIITECNSQTIAVAERSYRVLRDLFPLDVVLPQGVYASAQRLQALASAALTDTSHSTATFLISDPACPIHDVSIAYDYGTDFQPGESVVPRQNMQRLFVEGEELDHDPNIFGRVVSVNYEDETCSVMWFLQPDTANSELITRRPHDCGQVVETLPNTLVRVLWSDGVVEDISRIMLVPVRPMGAEDEEDEEEDENDTEETTQEIRTSEASDHALDDADENAAGDAGERGSSEETWLQKFKRKFTGLLNPTSDAEERGADEHLTKESDTDAGNDERLLQLPEAYVDVSMFSNHIFKSEGGTHGPIFLKRTQRELKDVVSHLTGAASREGPPHHSPPSIFVKSCSHSPELLKFVLIGAMHTPYYQSFLAFDLYYPPAFPMEPPSVRFHAYNLRLNPNLYMDGYICLSLLGTWESDDPSATWRPATSSVMQIIFSLQSLVLTKEPYYNEAGYDEYRGTAAGRASSKVYNENLSLMRIRHLIAMAESPPPDWVFAFRKYFLCVAPRIVARMSSLADRQEATPASEEDDSLPSSLPAAQATGVTADGLVLPLSKGFIHSLRRHLKLLEVCIDVCRRRWLSEEEAVSLQHLDQ